ncbi:MAG: hypothetical protein JW808_05830 [Victivallales bacterium]|nr:hypothetical protein [Victivallales bacterium]
MALNWTDGWDEGAGLWRQNEAGHTAPVCRLACVHAGPTASSRLLLAAQLNQLAAVNTASILRALRGLQVQSGERRGCMRWYLEEPGPVDTNAAFFAAFGLIPLRMCHGGELDTPSRETLDAILRDLRVWFDREAESRTFHYPNKFLGDVVCAWLLGEIEGAHSPALAGIMADAARYWHRHGWGWGEHMSDVYSRVCLDELSLLLLFSRHLPAELRVLYTGLLGELLAIDDAYGEGPRVPAIRTYDFLNRPSRIPYRSLIRPATTPSTLTMVQNMPLLGSLFHEHGWERLAPPTAEMRRGSLCIPCFGDTHADAWLAPDIRVGGMRRYPLMASADHPAWGLSWQSMPAAFWSPDGVWGFWQWETAENGVVRAHPATDRQSAFLGNALTSQVRPPITGRTFSLMKDGNLLVLRVMPFIVSTWARVTDRLRLVDPTTHVETRPPSSGWRQMLIRLPRRAVAVQCVPLTGRFDAMTPAPVQIERREPVRLMDWDLNLERTAIGEAVAMVTLWGVSVDGEVVAAPLFEPCGDTPPQPRAGEQRAWKLTWHWPNVTWNVRIDPLDQWAPIATTI